MDAYEKIFDEYYDLYGDAIFRHFFYRLQNRERAVDLTQEVFARFWDTIRAGTEIKNARAFLYRSAHNAFVNEIRDRKPNVSLDALSEKGFDVPYEDTEREAREAQRAIVDRLADLPERSRDVFIMRYVDGLEVNQIARILGESENAVSARLSRGRKKLKKLYEQEN